MSHEQLGLDLSTADEEARFSVGYLTIAEAALRVRCCERTIRRAIESGELRAGRVRGGGSSRGGFRIWVKDLDEWLYRDVS
jgi:excisionase family DNA binding protein